MLRGRLRISVPTAGRRRLRAEVPDGSELIVDALLGTGIDRPVDGAYRRCIDRSIAWRLPVLRSTSRRARRGHGRAAGHRDPRDAHACIHRPEDRPLSRRGAEPRRRARACGPRHSGRHRERETPVLRRIGPAVVAAALPVSSRTAHKGDHGRVLVIGGFAMAGAARLAGEAALRTGAGLVTIATSAEGAIPIVEARPELIVRPIASRHELESLIDAADAVAIGPGLGTDRRAEEALAAVDRRRAAARRGCGCPDSPRRGAAPSARLDPDAASGRSRTPARDGLRKRAARPARRVQEIAKRYGGICVAEGCAHAREGREPCPGSAIAAIPAWRPPEAAMSSPASSRRCSPVERSVVASRGGGRARSRRGGRSRGARGRAGRDRRRPHRRTQGRRELVMELILPDEAATTCRRRSAGPRTARPRATEAFCSRSRANSAAARRRSRAGCCAHSASPARSRARPSRWSSPTRRRRARAPPRPVSPRGGPARARGIGFRDMRGQPGLVIVEWPERAGAALGPSDLEVNLAHEGLGADFARGRRSEWERLAGVESRPTRRVWRISLKNLN